MEKKDFSRQSSVFTSLGDAHGCQWLCLVCCCHPRVAWTPWVHVPHWNKSCSCVMDFRYLLCIGLRFELGVTMYLITDKTCATASLLCFWLLSFLEWPQFWGNNQRSQKLKHKYLMNLGFWVLWTILLWHFIIKSNWTHTKYRCFSFPFTVWCFAVFAWGSSDARYSVSHLQTFLKLETPFISKDTLQHVIILFNSLKLMFISLSKEINRSSTAVFERSSD